MARPSLYSPELLDTICARLEAGEPLAGICRDEWMPAVRTFLQWADEKDEVATAYTRALAARAAWAEAEHERIRKTAVDRDTAAAARVQLTALEWQMSKMAPKRYGDSTMLRHANADGGRLPQLMSNEERAIRLASILQGIEARESK